MTALKNREDDDNSEENQSFYSSETCESLDKIEVTNSNSFSVFSSTLKKQLDFESSNS